MKIIQYINVALYINVEHTYYYCGYYCRIQQKK